MQVVLDWLYEQKFYLILAVASLFGYFWLSECKTKLNITGWQAMLLSILNTVFGMVCVKFFAFLEGEPGGMSLFGGVFFLPIFYYIGAKLTKRRVSDVCDAFALCTIFTVMCSRINCLIAGCCGGTVIPGTDDIRWPTQVMEMVFYILLMIYLGRKMGKPGMRGKIYPMYLMSYGVFRFLLEFLREKEIQSLFHLSHLWAVIAVIAGYYFYHRQTDGKKGKNGHYHDLKITGKEKGGN